MRNTEHFLLFDQNGIVQVRNFISFRNFRETRYKKLYIRIKNVKKLTFAGLLISLLTLFGSLAKNKSNGV